METVAATSLCTLTASVPGCASSLSSSYNNIVENVCHLTLTYLNQFQSVGDHVILHNDKTPFRACFVMEKAAATSLGKSGQAFQTTHLHSSERRFFSVGALNPQFFLDMAPDFVVLTTAMAITIISFVLMFMVGLGKPMPP